MRPPGTVWVAAALLSAAATVAAPLSHQASALGDAPSPAASGQAAQAGGGDVIVHLFQWPWESVAQECTDFLGPNGYDAVQVSPPQEHVVLEEEGHPWWQDYQPVSYRLESRRGDRDDFARWSAPALRRASTSMSTPSSIT
ncbi:alpha-amylase family protein [Allosalinactinospora lopnorensis]|uniref:hypothetical protein n=1 Tax=Allosalinactinospora lopnorensis TaxID=1352348 RepID=UPI0012E218AA|nr:hypothetical protein [Allosalinactinospora lopnorensis]